MRSRTEGGGLAVDSGRACALVALHPFPCHQQKAGIGDEVEQIIEPTIRIVVRPTVQLGLDLQYPLPGLQQAHAVVHSYSPAFSRYSSTSATDLLAPFAM